MGLLDRFKGKKGEAGAPKESEEAAEGRYDEPCALCGGTGTEKKWMGQYWHKKCVRSAKRYSKKMI